MPPKRKSFLDQLAREAPAQPPEAAPAAAPAPEPVNGNAKPASGRPGIKKSTLYLDDPVMDRLREIAFTERCKMHDLFLEGINHVIASRGHAERAGSKDAE